jgi:hypothetical protein
MMNLDLFNIKDLFSAIVKALPLKRLTAIGEAAIFLFVLWLLFKNNNASLYSIPCMVGGFLLFAAINFPIDKDFSRKMATLMMCCIIIVTILIMIWNPVFLIGSNVIIITTYICTKLIFLKKVGD